MKKQRLTHTISLAVLAVVVLVAGCQALQVKRSTISKPDAWLTEGNSPQRQHVTAANLTPPLEEVWTYNAGAGFGPGSPLVVGEAILVGTRQGEVHAIEFERGKKLGVEEFGETIEGTAVVRENVLYVPVGWGKRAVYAYDLVKGRTLWRVKHPPVEAGLLLLDDALISVDITATVRAYDTEDGSVRWMRELGEGEHTLVRATPVLAGSYVIIADDRGQVVALDPEDGSTAWTRDLGAPVYTTPAAQDRRLFVPTTRGRFVALDAETGREQWHLALPDTTVRFAPPAVADDRVFVGATDGTLRVLEISSGEVQWTFGVDAALTAPPLVTQRTVYLGSMGKMLYAVDRQSGAMLWNKELEGRVKSAMAVRRGHLVVLAEPRDVYLFRSTFHSEYAATP